MGYAEQQRQPGKHAVGIAVVIILHILLGWALASGLARDVARIVLPVTETVIIEEKKKPPPPPEPPPPPPKTVVVQQTFVPPPEVQIQQQNIPPPVISNPTPIAPPVFERPAPPAPVVAAPPPAAAIAVGVACPNSKEVREAAKYPPQARKDGLQGEVEVEFTVGTNGEIKDINVVSSSNRVFNSAAISSVRQFKCNAQGSDVKVRVPYSFKLSD
jgi:periplasmic protein TonB